MRRIVSWATPILALLSFASAPSRAADPLPEFYGFYAVDGGRLIEFQKGASADVNVGPNVKFIFFDKRAGIADARLSRLKYLRFVYRPEDEDFWTEAKKKEKVKANQWYRDDVPARSVELRSKPVPGQPEMVMLVPRAPLAAGAYALIGGGMPDWSFFVDKDAVIKTLASSSDCFDQIYSGGFDGMDQLASRRGEEVPCSQADRRAAGTTAGGAGSGSVSASGDSQPTSSQPPTPEPSAGYKNCVSLGTPPESCAILHPPADASRGSASDEIDKADKAKSTLPMAGTWVGEVKVVGRGWASCGVVLDLKSVAIGQVAGVLETQQDGAPYMDVPVLLTDAADGQFGLTWKPPIRCHRRGGYCSECTFEQIRLSPLDDGTAKAVAKTRSLSFEGTLSKR